MKTVIYFFATVFISALAQAHPLQMNEIPHWDPEMTGAEYESILEARTMQGFSLRDNAGSLDPLLALGKRNLDWLRFINQGRSPTISFSSAATQSGFPMDKPNFYNETIVLQRYNTLLTNLPIEMKTVLVDGKNFTKDPPMAVADYIKWGLEVDHVYQSATRWLMMQPYLDQLAWRRANDVRGFYFLSHDADRAKNFQNFDSLTTDKQTQYKEWLVEMCLNNSGTSASTCTANVEQGKNNHSLATLYARYLPTSNALWNQYFELDPGFANPNATWKDTNAMHVAFINPNDNDRLHFIKDDIEDEWRWKNWQLHTNFGALGVDVHWEPGITPHASSLGGSTIYMDANQPLTEYDGQWTIRHEFGHTLGFPDCYVEFYNDETHVITNYQLDTSNIMCSRRGHIQEQHVKELQKVYFHSN